jgi:hypothetical protein
MDIELKKFYIDKHVVCGQTLFNQPYFRYKGCAYFTLWDLFIEIPELLEDQHLIECAQVINFFARGLENQVITNIRQYVTEYRKRLLSEAQRYYGKPRISEYGEFDTSVMTSPRMVDGMIVFFVENTLNHMPYKISCDLTQRQYIKLELLPYA